MSLPRVGRRAPWLIALTAGVLGFALVVQVQQTRTTSGLPAAREEDLVRILDDLTSRSERLRSDIAELERTRDRISGGVDEGAAALAEARRRADVLGILAGTLPARGPGIVLTITDPERTIRAEELLDALQELRDAGAEAIELNGTRLVAASWFTGGEGAVTVEGRPLTPPYVFTAIGDPRTIAAAMDIPGGVIDVVSARAGARATVRELAEVVVDALRALPTPRYARPASDSGDS